MKTPQVPALPGMTPLGIKPQPASWVIIERATGKAVFEVWTKKLLARIRTDKYDIVPIGEWLARVNAEARR